MSTLSRTMRLGIAAMLFTLMLGVAPLTAAQPQAFEPNTYTSALTGLNINVSGPVYEIVEAELQHYPDGEGEIIRFGSETTVSSLEVSFFDDGDTPNGTIDIYLSAIEEASDVFEVIDRGVSGDHNYATAVVGYRGVEFIYFLQVSEDIEGTVDQLEAILTTTIWLEDDLAAAQAEISVGDVAFMDNVDPAALLAVVSGGGSLSGSSEPAPAEPAETFTLSEYDVTIGLGPDFSFAGESSTQPNTEVIHIQGPVSRSMVAVGETGSDPAQVVIDITAGITEVSMGTELVYEEIGQESGWRLLWQPHSDGTEWFTLIVVDTAVMPGFEVMHAHRLPPESVAGSIVTIQNQITFNGQPLMSEIDPAEIEFYADLYFAEDDGPAFETPVAVEQERRSDPRTDARLPSEPDAGEEENTSEVGEPDEATPATPGESGAPAELTDSSWQGELFGNLIEWDSDIWFVDVEYETDLVSDHEGDGDTIVLQPHVSSEPSFLYIRVHAEDGQTPQDYLDFWASDEYLDDYRATGASFEIIETRTRGGAAAIMFRVITPFGAEYISVNQAVILENGQILLVRLEAPVADVVDIYGDGQEVTINGDRVLQVFSPSQVQRIVGD